MSFGDRPWDGYTPKESRQWVEQGNDALAPERNYLIEAHAILLNRSLLIPEWEHLRALNDHYQSELIRLVHEIERVTTAALKRN